MTGGILALLHTPSWRSQIQFNLHSYNR